METIDIKADARNQVGKGSARAARRAGLVPAVIYGNKQSPIPITLDANKWRQLMHKPGILSQLMNIEVNNVKSIQKDWKQIVPYALYEWPHQL